MRLLFVGVLAILVLLPNATITAKPKDGIIIGPSINFRKDSVSYIVIHAGKTDLTKATIVLDAMGNGASDMANGILWKAEIVGTATKFKMKIKLTCTQPPNGCLPDAGTITITITNPCACPAQATASTTVDYVNQ